MLKYIILIADYGAVSFCHYENVEFDNGISEFIPLERFSEVVKYASEQKLNLNVILGNKSLPKDYLRILDNINHVKIVPYNLLNSFPDALPVLDLESVKIQSIILEKQIENIIIRLQGYPIDDLRPIIRHFSDNTKRINFVLKDIKELSEENLINYEYQLNKTIPLVEEFYLNGKSIEFNCLSDRLILNDMNNCNAGISHLTFAPNGKFYICPGFYYSTPENNVGSIKDGINIPNQELLQLKNAPICSVCDAFQCKRCVYLNKTITNEINIPSQQQCIQSHMERNASRRLFRKLKPSFQGVQELNDIPELDYLDPLEKVQEQIVKNKIKLYRICQGDKY